MNTVFFQIQKPMDLEEWEDHILYSGAETYPWWHEIWRNGSGDVVIEHKDPDSTSYYTDAPERHYTTLEKLARTASEMAAEYEVIAEAIINEDFDANAADLVLQYDVFGEIVYG